MSKSHVLRRAAAPLGALALAALLAGCAHGSAGVTPSVGVSGSQPSNSQITDQTVGGPVFGNAAQVCGAVPHGYARCLSLVRVDTPRLSDTVSPDSIPGYHPADLVSAYKLPSSTHGSGQQIAIVDAFDDPHA